MIHYAGRRIWTAQQVADKYGMHAELVLYLGFAIALNYEVEEF